MDPGRHDEARAGGRLPGHAPNDLFPTGDGSYIHIAAGNDSVFRRLADAMDRPDLKDDPRFAEAVARNENEAELTALITEWTMARSLADLDERLNAGHVPAAPIFDVADIFRDAHFRERDMLLTVPSDELDSVTVPGVVPKLMGSPGRVRWAGRPQGADTQAVLAEYLGMDGAAIGDLETQGVIGCGGEDNA